MMLNVKKVLALYICKNVLEEGLKEFECSKFFCFCVLCS